jgi:hypothetical protein
VLIKHTLTDYVTDLTFSPEIIEEAEENNQQIEAVNTISGAEKALKRHWGKKIANGTAKIITVQCSLKE